MGPGARHRLLAAACIACVALALQPENVRASCGDYVQIGGRHGAGAKGDRHPAMPMPCRGEGCHESPPPLVPTVPLSWKQMSEQWACAVGRSTTPPWPDHWQPVCTVLRWGEEHPQRLERPPRDFVRGKL
jgi:hypothetical protein